jgi:predicted acylesterase/phospholipase RssA
MRGVPEAWPRRVGGPLVALAAAWLIVAGPVRGQSPNAPGPQQPGSSCPVGPGLPPCGSADGASPPFPVGLVIQGGASLGSFEAGAAFYLAQVFRLNPQVLVPRVVTGTSAGSINALLFALDACGGAAASGSPPGSGAVVPGAGRTPSESLFWKVWRPVGLEGLFDPAKVTATAVLTRDGVMREVTRTLEEAFARGLPAGCDVVLGVPVTRVETRKVRLDREGTLPLSRAGERFSLRVRGRGPGQAPSVQNYLDSDAVEDQIALATDARGDVPFGNLMALLYASSGIPGAFAPVAIPHCLVAQGKVKSRQSGRRAVGLGPVTCEVADADTAAFVDGGFLDNQPLRLATRLLVRGLGEGGALRDRPDLKRFELPPEASLLTLVPSSMPWAPDPAPERREGEGLFAMLGRMLPGLLEAARTSELHTVIEEHPEIRNRIAVLQSDWPTASGVLGAFMGFVEGDFRAFDFHLGMHEGRRLATTTLASWARARGHRLVLPDPGPDASAAVREGWRPVRCLGTILGHDVDPDAAWDHCGFGDMWNARALIQTSIDRLYARCRRLPTDVAALLPLATLTDARRHCIAAYAGEAPPRVPALEGQPPAPDSTNPDGVTYFLARLAAYRFDFKDLGAGRASAEGVTRRLAARIGAMSRALAAAQPERSTLYRSVARYLTHGLIWTPPSHALHLLAGSSWEFGWSVADSAGSVGWLRFATALQFDGLASVLDGEARPWFGVTPLVGFELEPFAGPMLQTRLGLRGGFRLATGDRFLTDEHPAEPSFARSRPLVDAHLAGVLAQWVRLQLEAAWLPAWDGAAATFLLRAMVGVELDLPL